MRSKVLLICATSLCLVLAGCGQSGSDGGSGTFQSGAQQPAQEAAADAAAGPSVNVTAAPGVAFDYRYAFRLLPAHIAKVQEEHAQQCEKLGIARCRITGMRYTVEDEDRISAMLALKLDPAIARDFGKQGIAAVDKAGGMLVDAQITGVDAGSEIKRASRGAAQLQDELGRIEAQLRAGGLTNAQRADLNARASGLRDQIRALGETRRANEESLATTPMVFEYRAGHTIPGLDGGSPIADAIAAAVRSFIVMVSFLMLVIGTLLPWAILAGGIYWLIRRVRPDLVGAKPRPAPEPPTE
jgi:hypothetical protein